MKTQAELAGELFAVGWAAGHRECDTTRIAQLEDIKRQLRRATWHEGSSWNGDLSGGTCITRCSSRNVVVNSSR